MTWHSHHSCLMHRMVMKMPEHTAHRICSGTWQISEFNLVNFFLAEGDDKAAVIDTGCGLGNARSAVMRLTDKPLSVLLTHTHFDHMGGIYRFTDCPVFMKSDEEGKHTFSLGTGKPFLKHYVGTRAAVLMKGKEAELLSLIPEEETDVPFSFSELDDGDIIDLGGRTLECIAVPGHTAGSLCFLDRKEQLLFSGDCVNRSVILPRQQDGSMRIVEQYHDSLKKLMNREKEFETLAIGHNGPLEEKSLLRDYLTLSEGLLDGSIRGKYMEKGFRKGEVASYGNAELWYQCDQ